jgi:hypothetical protein
MKKKAIIGGIGMLLFTGAGLYAQGKVSAKRHPNLAAAQRYCDDAITKLAAAQQANEFDMGGHAKKAKELLAEASSEIKQAGLAANAR